MAGKISDLTAIGSGAAATDLLEMVDVSDTSMASTGTNKKMLLSDLSTFIGAPPTGTKLSALADVGTGAATADVLEIVDVSDTTMAASGTNKKLSLANLSAFIRPTVRNASVADQTGFAADTYVTGSSIAIPAGRLQAKTMYRCQIAVTKNANGTAAPALNLRFGTAGTTADTSRGALTFVPLSTAAIDTGVFDITAVFRTVGSGTTAVISSMARLTHNLQITGFSVLPTAAVVATSGGFDSTVASSIIGVSANGGASAAWTVTLVTAELLNLS